MSGSGRRPEQPGWRGDESRYARPIFQTEGFEEIDETWRHGAYIGGMAAVGGTEVLASSYLAAARLLIQQSVRDHEAYGVVLPALFLLRHALELRLKALVRPSKLHHDLDRLVTALDERLKRERGSGLPTDLVARIRELHAMDRRSVAFRFHDGQGGAGAEPCVNEVWVDLVYFLDVVGWVDRELAALARGHARREG